MPQIRCSANNLAQKFPGLSKHARRKKPSPHRPPCMENEDRIKTRTLINDQMNGIHVDIVKEPEL
jgi:hypothetical protein